MSSKDEPATPARIPVPQSDGDVLDAEPMGTFTRVRVEATLHRDSAVLTVDLAASPATGSNSSDVTVTEVPLAPGEWASPDVLHLRLDLGSATRTDPKKAWYRRERFNEASGYRYVVVTFHDGHVAGVATVEKSGSAEFSMTPRLST